MQIASYESYEQEKKRNEGKYIGELYSSIYKLESEISRYKMWQYTDFAFENTNENILLCIHIKTRNKYGDFGRFFYNFYVIEKNEEYYIRYFDLNDTYSFAEEQGKKAINNTWAQYYVDMGIRTKEYKNFIINNKMSNRIIIDKNKFFDKLSKPASIKFEDHWNEFLEYSYATTTVEILDFKNRNAFYTDEYILSKFSPYVDLIEWVVNQCKIPGFNKCNLEYIDTLDEAKEILVDKWLKRQYFIY